MLSSQNIKSTRGSTIPFCVTKGKLFKGLIEVELEGVKVDATRAWALKGLTSNLRNYAQPILEDIKIGRELIPLPPVAINCVLS